LFGVISRLTTRQRRFPIAWFDSADIFLSPAPSGPFPVKLSVFNGHNANGTWSLFVVDDFLSDAGQIGAGALVLDRRISESAADRLIFS